MLGSLPLVRFFSRGGERFFFLESECTVGEVLASLELP